MGLKLALVMSTPIKDIYVVCKYVKKTVLKVGFMGLKLTLVMSTPMMY
jgi:hypothetical protein